MPFAGGLGVVDVGRGVNLGLSLIWSEAPPFLLSSIKTPTKRNKVIKTSFPHRLTIHYNYLFERR
jgi:hypothetical protein